MSVAMGIIIWSLVASYAIGCFWSFASYDEYRGLPHRIAHKAPTRDAEKAVHILFGLFSPLFIIGAILYGLVKVCIFSFGAFGVFYRGIRDLIPKRKPKTEFPKARVL